MIPNLSPYARVLVSERHRALIRTGAGSTEIVVQDYRTGETNRIIKLPAGSGSGSMAVSPDHHWLYVAYYNPAGPQGAPTNSLVEINLLMPEEPRLIGIPNSISRIMPTDGRLVILNVNGTTLSAPYLLRVLDAASGRLGPTKTVSNYPVAASAEQTSVFALGTVAATMEETFRHTFDPVTLNPNSEMEKGSQCGRGCGHGD